MREAGIDCARSGDRLVSPKEIVPPPLAWEFIALAIEAADDALIGSTNRSFEVGERSMRFLHRCFRGNRRANPMVGAANGLDDQARCWASEIDWGKNYGFVDHSALYQSGDVRKVHYYYAGEEIEGKDGEPDWEVITEMKDGLSKPLAEVIDRIDLLGHTRTVCECEFTYLAEFNGFDPASFSFDDLRKALSTIDVSVLSPNYGEGGEDFGKFFRREILPRLNLNPGGIDPMGIQRRFTGHGKPERLHDSSSAGRKSDCAPSFRAVGLQRH